MRLDRLRVEGVPGLPEPFVLVPAPGVNILLGPNASGKSSVARAVRGLLWPELEGAQGHHLVAEFADARLPLLEKRLLDVRPIDKPLEEMFLSFWLSKTR